MSAREELLERQVASLEERASGIATVARLAFEGQGNGASTDALCSVLLMIEREAETLRDLLGDLTIPQAAKPRVVPIRKTAPADAEPEHAQ